MGYYELGTLPVLHRLAAEFTVCDRWFSSVPGPTWTNRLFAHSGTALGRVEMPNPPFDLNLHNYNQTTLYDRLSERKIDWRIYYGDVPQSLVLSHQRSLRNALKYRRFARFYEDVRGPASAFPAYTFLEPNYFFEQQNDQHPPSDVMKGEILIARVYNALRSNDALWERTLFVVLYDEHGGFYDHVYPGPAVPPDAHREEYDFTQFGVRVPAILISPWAARRVFKTELDHTSLLRYVSDKWALGPLGERVAHANSIGAAITGTFRTDTPRDIPEPAIPSLRAALGLRPSDPPLNDLQRALFALTEVLEAETVQHPEVKAARALRALDGSVAQGQVAADRVERFLQQQRGK
jgi:phospholipase C